MTMNQAENWSVITKLFNNYAAYGSQCVECGHLSCAHQESAVSHAHYKKYSRARIACNILSVRIFGLFIVLEFTAVSRIELRRRVFGERK